MLGLDGSETRPHTTYAFLSGTPYPRVGRGGSLARSAKTALSDRTGGPQLPQLLLSLIDTDGNYANQSHSIFRVTKELPYVIKLVTTIPTGKWVTVTLSMI